MSFGAYAGEQLVGIAISEARQWNRSLWIWELMVAKPHQRLGAGRLLVGALAEKACAAGLRVLVAETQNTNAPAIRFYRSVGFEIDGVDLSYYTNTDAADYEVAIFMKKKL
jgi:ribosomal protein S18 acetylase RimI-like enzyme